MRKTAGNRQNDDMKKANIGSISHGTLRTADLLNAFCNELEWQLRRNGNYFAHPENREEGRKIHELCGECQDQYEEDGETLKDEDTASELVESLTDSLQQFAPAYCYFGAHEGDGSDFGFWPSIESIEELPCYEGTEEALKAGETNDFRVVNDHGNVTVYSASGNEIIALV
jgi:hypothetical protein